MGGEGKTPSPRKWILLSATLLLTLAAILPPMLSVGRYQRRIAASISRSIGQPVHLSSVKLRLLPRPGFELTDFIVEEKPGFGAEPILRSASVVASLRLWPLWRGELEFARIDFDQASLNLVRATDGTWNFASILLQAARVQAAHSGNSRADLRRAGAASRFPSIQATRSRVNFKQGEEKKPLSFLNSDLSVWLENADEWGIHFRAQPVRTDLDLDLSDTGILRIDGTLRRAAVLSRMPIRLKAEWSNAPLGQLSRLTLGHDIGWRGDLDIQAEVNGTADLTRIKTRLEVNGLHRAEFAPAHPLDIQTLCEGSYRKPSASLDDIACTSPVGRGELRLTGFLQDTQTQPRASLDLDIHRIPASAVLAALEEVRSGLGGGFGVSGTVNGHFRYRSPGFSQDSFAQDGFAADGSAQAASAKTRAAKAGSKDLDKDQNKGAHSPRKHAGATPPADEFPLSGEVGASSLTLLPAAADRPFTVAGVRLVIDSQTAPGASAAAFPIEQWGLLMEPVQLALGGPAPLAVGGRFSLAGFDFHLRGPGKLARLHTLSHALGLLNSSTGRLSPVAPPGATSGAAQGEESESAGDVTLDVNVRGPWLLPIPDAEHPLASSITLGSVAVANAEISSPYLSQPLKVASAQAVLGPNYVSWTNASISYGNLKAQGALEYPAICAPSPPCPAQFQLSAPALDLGELQSTLFGADQGQGGQLLREIFGRIEGRSGPWPALSGTVQVGALSLGNLVLRDAAGSLDIAGRSMVVRSLNGRLLNGAMHLAGALDAAGDKPDYQLDVQVANASPSAFAALFGEQWGSGLLNFSAQWTMSGLKAADLAQSSSGVLHWNWTRGSLLPEVPLLAAAEPLLHFDDWSGDAAIEGAGIKIKQSLLSRGREAIPLSGTISFDRKLALESEPALTGFSITGTLDHPAVKSSTAEAEAHAVPLHQ